MTNTATAVTVIEQPADSGVVEWNLDSFPEDRFNRLVPVATLQLPTDLLRPVVQIVQLNPDPKAGDVYSSRDMPDGHAAPTRVALRKFATAAGISFVDERRTDDGTDPDVIEVTTIAVMLLPTGQRLTATGSKRVDLNAQTWSSPAQRAKYRSFFFEHVASRAQNRAIRALLSLRGSYPVQIYQRPFAVVSFTPNLNHPEVRTRMLDAMTGAAAQLYGPAAAKQLEAGKTINVSPAPEDDPAPPAPTALPGERLAKAPADDVPDWARPAPSTEAQQSDPGPTLVERLRDRATKSGMKGEATAPQKAGLRAVIGELDWSTETAPVLAAAFGDDATRALSAAQAAAILAEAEAIGEAFRAEWIQAAAA